MDNQVAALIESDISKKQFRKNWARLIQKIYNVDPLFCLKCSGEMRIISFVEDNDLIKKILKHLNLWLPSNNSPPKNNSATYNCNRAHLPNYDSCSQIEYEDNYSQVNHFDDF